MVKPTFKIIIIVNIFVVVIILQLNALFVVLIGGSRLETFQIGTFVVIVADIGLSFAVEYTAGRWRFRFGRRRRLHRRGSSDDRLGSNHHILTDARPAGRRRQNPLSTR